MTEDENRAVRALQDILRESPAVVETLLGFPWLADGVTEDESLAVYHLWVILREDPAVAQTLLGFLWLPDGVTNDEMHALYNLREILREDQTVVETLLGFPWLADGVAEDESRVIYDLRQILREDQTVAEALLNFPWLADSVTKEERNAVYYLREIRREAPAIANTLLGFPWLADAVTRDEAYAIYHFGRLLRKNPAMAKVILESPWFSDGVSRTDRQIVWGIRYLHDLGHGSISTMTAKPWFKDGLTYEEFRLVGDLGDIAYRSEADFLAIIGMPFLEIFDPADVLAVNSLRRLTSCRDVQTVFSVECSDNEPSGVRVSKKFRQAMSHPTISDGISDEEATIVATLFSARRYNPDIFDSLLDPDTVTLEERTINLPHTGETQLTIVRIRPGVERTMDLLERAVKDVEGFMGVPLPVSHVIFLPENTVAGGASNAYTNMTGKHGWFDTDERPDVDPLHVFAHETAHWYWSHSWNRHWVAEGLATFFQSLTRTQAGVGHGEPVLPIWPPHLPPCPIHSNIAELEKLDRDKGVISYCSDSFGERLFQDLWRTLGDSVFQQGLANLYLTARSGAPVAGCKSDEAGMCQVKAAFKAAAPAEAAATVDKVMDRWYYNSEPYDLSHVDTSPANPNLPGGGAITRAYISLDRNRPEETRTDSFSASEIREQAFLHLHFSLPSGWQTQKLPLTFVEYFEDGFAYKIIEDPRTFYAGRTQTSLSYRVGAWPGRMWRIRNNEGEDRTWRPGRYWVSVYHGDQKVAEVEFQVTP